jgi:2-iminoacetate synthase ThiH
MILLPLTEYEQLMSNHSNHCSVRLNIHLQAAKIKFHTLATVIFTLADFSEQVVEHQSA